MRVEVLLMLALALTAFHPQAGEGVSVAVTAPMMARVVEAVGGERVEIKVIIPEGADPHSYEPGEMELLEAVAAADLVVMTGPSHLIVEEKLGELASRGLISAEMIDYEDYLEEGLRLLRNPETGALNPHGYIFSLSGLEAMAKAVARGLSKVDPAGTSYYEEMLARYLAKLEETREAIEALGVKDKRVALLTPIFQYVAEDLGLEVADVVLSELETEPSERDVAELVEVLRGGMADVVLLSDLEASRHGKLLSLLDREGARYMVVPLLKLAENPELIPLSAALLLTNAPSVGAARSGGFPWLTFTSLAANVILLGLVVLLFWKVRGYGG